MTQEEKAKAYDEALERVEGLIDFCSDSELKTLEYVFPKLKESEDEKIKNGLVRLLKELLELGGVAISFAGSGSVSFEPGGIVSDKPVSNRGEYVVTKDERQRLEAMLKSEPDREVVHVSINLDDLTMAEKRKLLRR